MAVQAEGTLPDRAALEKIILNLTVRFIHLDPKEVDGAIRAALQAMGEAVGASYAALYLISPDRKKLARLQAWHSQQDKLPVYPDGEWFMTDWPWKEVPLERGQVMHLSPYADSSADTSSPKDMLRELGCQSLLLIPLAEEKATAGILGLGSAAVKKSWPEDMIAPLGLMGEILIIVLERRRVEEQLRQVEERYRNLVENINDVIFSLDTRGYFTYVSPVIERVALYRAEEMFGQPFADFIFPEDLHEFLNFLWQTICGQAETREFRILNKGGGIREVRISIRRLLEGDQTTGLTGIMSDVTDRKWAELLLHRAEERYRSIFANAVEGIFQCTLEGRFIVANPACAHILGYAFPEELTLPVPPVKQPYFVNPDRYQELQRLLEERRVVKGFEAQVYRKDGNIIWISMNALAIRDSNGAVLFYEGTMEDITERKRAEDQIRYLSFHDNLTGLYNRVYFEEELKRLDTERQLPISVIMADANGLKLVNDVFSHQAGDRLLIRMATILKECCRKEDAVARLGGDEFAIFLPRTSHEVSLGVVERIKLACSQASPEPVQPSMALGVATKVESSQDIQEIMKAAEERMYHCKLLESKSVRDSIIHSLQSTLFERSHEFEAHTHRLQELALKMARALGLTDGEMDELALLATLHDIGRIAIPEGIIIKPGNLTPEEWEMIWKHPETGYRIAGASPELAPIAEAILAHHEWWDGKGYPRGLKGQEIPLLSRIIAIAEAYDVMTHGSPYKKAVTQGEALQELKSKAGSQFDPKLVDLFVNRIAAE